jgi:hypothetical protein
MFAFVLDSLVKLGSKAMNPKVLASVLFAATALSAAAFSAGFESAATSWNQADAAQVTSTKSQRSPRQVLEEFCELDLQGKQLTLEGRQEVAQFFVKPESPPLKDIVVAMDCVVSEPAMNGNTADFYVEQMMLGHLDSSLSYKPANPDHPDDPIMVRRDQSLVLTGEYWKAGPGGENQKIIGPPTWRIDSQHSPSISVEAAIGYVARMRDSTNDKTAKENANKTLTVLALLNNVGNPYAKKGPSLTDSERRKLSDLIPKQNPCPEIGPMDTLKRSAEVTARQIAVAIEAQDSGSVLSLTSAHGIGFQQLGDEWPHFDELVSEFSNKTGYYCRFFDTSCVKQPVQSPIAPWLPKRTYSYREWLTRSRPYDIDVDLTRATDCAAAIIFVRSGKTSDESLPKDLYLQLSYETSGWRLLSIGYGFDIP